MGERRKRRSLWDKEADTKHFSGQYHSSDDSAQYHEVSASQNYRTLNFRDQSGQPFLESLKENPGARMNSSYIKSRENIPEGNEIGEENRYYQKMSPGLKHSHSLGNDQSHSRRSLGRGRSRSRSRTRGRSRSRSLSRGRERERERERARGRSKSRSRSRDDGVARGHRNWRNRTDDDNISKQSYSNRGPRSESQNDVSDLYHGEDEQFQNRSRSAVPCKDFIKGKCRWGDTCRFSHHFASDETSGKGTRHSSTSKDSEQQPYKNGRPPCKYFAAGKCDRSNFRFSHEGSKFDCLEGGQGKVTDEGSLGNDNLGIRSRTEKFIDRDRQSSPPARSGSYSGDLGIIESFGKENMANKREMLMFHGSQLQNQDRDLNVQVSNILEVDQQFPNETWQNHSQVSPIQQQAHGVLENNPVTSFKSDILNGVKDSTNDAYPIPLSGQSTTPNGENDFSVHSSIANKTDSGLISPNPSSLVANLIQSQMQNPQNSIQMTGMLEMGVPQFFSNLITSQQSAQFTNPLVSVTGQQVSLVETANLQSISVNDSQEPINPMENDRDHTEQGTQMQVGRSSSSNTCLGPNNSNLDEGKVAIDEDTKGVKINKHFETLDAHGKAEDSIANKDDKGMRLFKNSLIEFVKDILKPTWKEGRMSREVHKTIVKKVVDKVICTIQVDHIPKTQDKVEQYLSCSRPKIAKLVQAYVGRCLKTDS